MTTPSKKLSTAAAVLAHSVQLLPEKALVELIHGTGFEVNQISGLEYWVYSRLAGSYFRLATIVEEESAAGFVGLLRSGTLTCHRDHIIVAAPRQGDFELRNLVNAETGLVADFQMKEAA